MHIHLVVEDLGFTRFGLGDQRLVEDVENILADLLELQFNLLAVFTDGADVLVRAPGLLLLLDGGDDAPRSTTSANDVLVRDGEEIALIDSEFSTNLN